MIPHFSIVGAAVATLCSFFVSAAYLFFISKGKIKINYNKINIIIITLSGFILLFAGLYLQSLVIDLILLFCFIFLVRYLLKIELGTFWGKLKSRR